MKKEYTAPEFESLDLLIPAIMATKGVTTYGGIIDELNPSDGAGEDMDFPDDK